MTTKTSAACLYNAICVTHVECPQVLAAACELVIPQAISRTLFSVREGHAAFEESIQVLVVSDVSLNSTQTSFKSVLAQQQVWCKRPHLGRNVRWYYSHTRYCDPYVHVPLHAGQSTGSEDA
jgi:hypothetical protein